MEIFIKQQNSAPKDLVDSKIRKNYTIIFFYKQIHRRYHRAARRQKSLFSSGETILYERARPLKEVKMIYITEYWT